MSEWAACLPEMLRAVAQRLLAQLQQEGMTALQAQEKLCAISSRAWLTEQWQQPDSAPFIVLEDAAVECIAPALLAQEAAERQIRGGA